MNADGATTAAFVRVTLAELDPLAPGGPTGGRPIAPRTVTELVRPIPRDAGRALAGTSCSWAGDELCMDLAVHPPVGRRARLVEIVLRERWRAVGSDRWELAEYGYELRHHELTYRRALHRHDVNNFVRTYGVATHEHSEAAMGNPAFGHYLTNPPCRGALDGFDRLYGVWLAGTKPDCSQLRCLG